MKLAEEDEKTLVLSKPSLPGYNRAVEQLGLVIDAPDWNQDDNTKQICRRRGREMTNFRWLPGLERRILQKIGAITWPT